MLQNSYSNNAVDTLRIEDKSGDRSKISNKPIMSGYDISNKVMVIRK